MPKKDVDLTLTVKKTGAIKVTVYPFQRHISVKDDDYVRFNFKGDLTYAEIKFTASNWPFVGSNHLLEGSSSFSSPKIDPGMTPDDVCKYTITLYFDDIDGVERSVTIDPDMVIDT